MKIEAEFNLSRRPNTLPEHSCVHGPHKYTITSYTVITCLQVLQARCSASRQPLLLNGKLAQEIGNQPYGIVSTHASAAASSGAQILRRLEGYPAMSLLFCKGSRPCGNALSHVGLRK